MSDDRRPSVPEGHVRLRDQQGALTRLAILRAARVVFARRGFARASIRELAEEAGVAVQTIYATFGSKAGLLAGLPDLIDEESGIHDVIAERDRTSEPGELIRLFVRLVRRVWSVCGDIMRLLRDNAAQPEVGAAYGEAMRRHRFGLEWTAGRIAEASALRPGLSAGRAADIMEAVLVLEVADVLVGKRGWSWDEYEEWAVSVLSWQLLRERSRPGGSDDF